MHSRSISREGRGATQAGAAGRISLRLGLRGRGGAGVSTAIPGLGAVFSEVRRGLRHTAMQIVCGVAAPADIPLAEAAAATGVPLTILLPEPPEAFLARCDPREAERLRVLNAPLRCAGDAAGALDPRDAIARGLADCDLLWIVDDEFPSDPGTRPFTLTRLLGVPGGGWTEFNWFPRGHDLRQFATWLSRIDGFNADVGGLDDAVKPRSPTPDPARMAAGSDIPTPEACAGAMFAAADRLAVRLQRRTWGALVGLLVAAYLAAVLFQAHVRLRFLWGGTPATERPWFLRPFVTLQGGDQPRVYLWWEDLPYLLLVTGIVAGYLLLRRFAVQRRQFEYRALAECLRIQGAWRLAGLEDRVAEELPFAADGDLAWLGTALAHWDDGLAGARPPLERERRERAVEAWIDGQRHYHEARAGRSGAVAAWIGRVGVVTLWAGLTLLYLRAFAPPDHLASIALWLLVAAGAVVAIYGRVTAVHEHARMHARSAATFAEGRRVLDEAARAGHPASAAGLALRLGSESLAELAFWLRLHKERPVELPRV